MYTSKGKQRRRVAWCFQITLSIVSATACSECEAFRFSSLLSRRPQSISRNIRSSSLAGCLPGKAHSLYLNRPESIFQVRFVKFHLTVINQPTPWNRVRTTSTSASQELFLYVMQPGGSLPCLQQPATRLPGATGILSMLSICTTCFNSFPSTRCPYRRSLSPQFFCSMHATCPTHPILVFIDSWRQILIMNLLLCNFMEPPIPSTYVLENPQSVFFS